MPTDTIEIQGNWDEKFDALVEIFAQSLKAGADLGASFAATIDGELVVDIWGGHLDEEKTSPWQENTIINVYSTTKTMCFLCTLILADRGQLDFDTNVADYWPEFAQNGKADIKMWHIMDHAAGLSGLDVAVSTEDLYDWDKMVSLLAAQPPWWQPGTASGYHAVTQGYLIGEVVRRISGKTLGQFFQKEVAESLQADFHIGVPDALFSRVADLIPAEGAATNLSGNGQADSIAARTFANPAIDALTSRTHGWRKAEIPAANGHGNARSVAQIQAVLACQGEAQGRRLFSQDIARMVMRERISGTDLVLDTPQRFGLGYGLNNPDMPISPNKNVCFWGGWGGSAIIVDQDARASIAYVMNKMETSLEGDMRSANLIGAFYGALTG